MSMSFTYTQYFDHNKIYNLLNSIIDKGIQSGRQVHQLSPVAKFTHRWVTDMTGSCFVILLICHWWWRNPPLERAQRRRLIPIIREKNNLWIENLRSINPLKESTHILLG
jgi:hypothetical protein